jgi:N-acetylglucosamine-6-phosphate deacetylase
MNVAVRTINQKVGVPLKDAILMATTVPAKAIGLFDSKGSLAVGKDADIVICDSSVRVLKVLVGGKIVYEAH